MQVIPKKNKRKKKQRVGERREKFETEKFEDGMQSRAVESIGISGAGDYVDRAPNNHDNSNINSNTKYQKFNILIMSQISPWLPTVDMHASCPGVRL